MTNSGSADPMESTGGSAYTGRLHATVAIERLAGMAYSSISVTERLRRRHCGIVKRSFHERRGLPGVPSHIVPLRVREGDPQRAMAACEALLERGIFAQGIRPPTVPPGTARLRFALMATHTRAQLDAAIDALDELHDYFA